MSPPLLSPVVSPPLLSAVSPEELEATCGQDPHWACREVLELTGSELLGDIAEWILSSGTTIALILIGAFVVIRLTRRAIKRSLRRAIEARLAQRLAARAELAPEAPVRTEEELEARSGQRMEALSAVLGSTAGFGIWLVAGFLILAELGVNLAPLIAGAGVAGLAIGFGAQSLVKDFVAGVFILLEDQFAVGDVVDLGEGGTGTVEDLSLRRTRLRSVAGTVWHVANGEIVRVGNMSQHWARALLDIEVAYATDLEQAKRVIKRVADEVASKEEDILDEPSVWGVEALGASGIAIRLVVKTRPAEQWRIMRTLRERLKEAFDEEGIEIPFPQQTVWMRPDPAAGREGPTPRAPGGE